jgi:thioester reductase-like protein
MNLGRGICAWKSQSFTGESIVIATHMSVDSVVLDFACLFFGLIPVRIHPQSSYYTWINILHSSKPHFVAIEDSDLTNLKQILCNNPQYSQNINIILLSAHPNVNHSPEIEFASKLETLGKTNAGQRYFPRRRFPHEIFMNVTSSGSTSVPKTFPLTEHDVLSQMKNMKYGFYEHPNVTAIWSTSDRVNLIFHLCTGGRVLLCGESSTQSFPRMFSHIGLAKPTFLVGTPVVWNSFYKLYQNLCYEIQYANTTMCTEDVQTLARSQVSTMFGNRLKSITSGGAPLPEATRDLLNACFKNVSDIYGTTEVGGITSNGVLRKGVRIKLRDWQSYQTTDFPHPRGELLVKKSNSWFETGDVVELLTPTRIQILERSKSLCKLSNGEWFNPEPVENFFKSSSRIVSQILLYANPSFNNPIALVIPDVAKLIFEFELTSESKFPTEDWKLDLKVLLFVRNHLKELGKALRKYQNPAWVVLDDAEFSTSNMLLTPSFKLSRNRIIEKYQAQFDDAWQYYLSLSEMAVDTLTGTAQDPTNKALNALQDILREFQTNIQEEFQLDSIAAVQVSQMYKEKTGITLHPTQLIGSEKNPASLRQLKDYLNNQSNGKLEQFPPLEYVDFNNEKRYLKSLLSLPRGEKFNCMDSGDVFLTGSTGFLGGIMLLDLLEMMPDSTRIYCLVRCTDKQHGLEKLLAHLRKLNCLPNCVPEWFSTRVKIVPGDLAYCKFGLREDKFAKLATKVNVIYHVGASVSGVSSYHSLRAANVLGTVHCIHLAVFGLQENLRSSVCRFHFVSSAAVFNCYPSGELMQEKNELLETPSAMYMDGYSRSKWIADRLCLFLKSNYGIPVNIYRPGFISSHSVTGAGNLDDFDNRFILAILSMKYAPKVECLPLDQSPVDWVSKSIVRISVQAEAENKCFHFMNPDGSSNVRDILRVLGETAGLDLNWIPYGQWRNLLDSLPETNPLFPLVACFPQQTFPARFGNRCSLHNTKELLSKLKMPTGVNISESSLISWFQWLQKNSK